MKPSHIRPSRQALFEAIRAVSEPQRGVISRAQLLEVGLSASSIRRWATDGVLTEVFRGTYSLDRSVSRAGERWAGHLSVGARSVVSHDSAVDALDLVTTARRPVHLVVAGRPPRTQAGVIVHQNVGLHADDVVDLDGHAHTNTACTLADVADPLDPARLDRLLDRAVHLRLFDATAIEALLGRRKVSAGTRALEAAIARLDHTAGRNRSELERLVIALIRDSHLPPAINNARIGAFEVDVWWWGTRAIVEADGDRFHSSPAQVARDIAKRKALEAYGFAVMRLSWAEANYDTDRTLQRIDQFRLANQAPAVPGPPAELHLTTGRRW
jgi:very-short-patch-repair endonuclease